MGVQLVWFKRDLRVNDHKPLWNAAAQGPCLCLYVYEPEFTKLPISTPPTSTLLMILSVTFVAAYDSLVVN